MSGTENNNDCYFHYYYYRHNKKANIDELNEKKENSLKNFQSHNIC